MMTSEPIQKQSLAESDANGEAARGGRAYAPPPVSTAAPVQRQADSIAPPLPSAPANNTGLPNDLKAGVEAMSGYDLSDVNVHYNSSKPAQLQALAYTQGTDIHVGPGQEKHLPHEAWHVVQQKQGRVQSTMQMKGIDINDDTRLEREADSNGKRALRENNNAKVKNEIRANKRNTTEGKRQPEIVQRVEDYKKHKIIGINKLESGDILHLRVEGVITGHHPVRTLIKIGQESALKSLKKPKKSERAYKSVFTNYQEKLEENYDDINETASEKRGKGIKDLIHTGHTSIYIGEDKVIETTGEGVRKRALASVDTARYVVMRAKNPKLRSLIVEFAEAIGADQGEQVLGQLSKIKNLPNSVEDYVNENKEQIKKTIWINEKYDTSRAITLTGKDVKTKTNINDNSNPLIDMITVEQDKRLHRNTVCSSFVALVIDLAERTLYKSQREQSQISTDSTPISIGSVFISPKYVNPSYLEMGMKSSENFQVVGQFINFGSMKNARKKSGEPIKIHRPHKAYLKDTEKFLEGLTDDETREINIPKDSNFKITGSSISEKWYYGKTRKKAEKIISALLDRREKIKASQEGIEKPVEDDSHEVAVDDDKIEVLMPLEKKKEPSHHESSGSQEKKEDSRASMVRISSGPFFEKEPEDDSSELVIDDDGGKVVAPIKENNIALG